MSAIARNKLLTAEEFYLLPDPEDGSRQDLVRGEIYTMPPPGGLHGVICSKTNRRLGIFIDAGPGGTLVCNDTGFITERDPTACAGRISPGGRRSACKKSPLATSRLRQTCWSKFCRPATHQGTPAK